MWKQCWCLSGWHWYSGWKLSWWLQLHYSVGDRRLIEDRGNNCLLCLLRHVLTHLFLWRYDSMRITLSMKWAASEKWYIVIHCLVAFHQCTETSKTVSESSSSSGSLRSNSCSRCASVGMRRAGFSCLLSVEEMGDFYIVFEMFLWI